MFPTPCLTVCTLNLVLSALHLPTSLPFRPLTFYSLLGVIRVQSGSLPRYTLSG